MDIIFTRHKIPQYCRAKFADHPEYGNFRNYGIYLRMKLRQHSETYPVLAPDTRRFINNRVGKIIPIVLENDDRILMLKPVFLGEVKLDGDSDTHIRMHCIGVELPVHETEMSLIELDLRFEKSNFLFTNHVGILGCINVTDVPFITHCSKCDAKELIPVGQLFIDMDIPPCKKCHNGEHVVNIDITL